MSHLRAPHIGLLISLLMLASIEATAADVGRIKVSSGAVFIERSGQRMPAPVDTALQVSDTIVTGSDGSVGITFIDNTRFSAGPNSVVAIDRFAFNQTTHTGNFDTTVKRGTLGVVSGKMAKQSPDAMTVRTPSMILGVRGTEFLVYAE